MISTGSDEKTIMLNLMFIVKDYHIVDISEEFTSWRILCDLDNCIPLNTVCDYATSKDLDRDRDIGENPYEIARSILQQVGYKLFPLTKSDNRWRESFAIRASVHG